MHASYNRAATRDECEQGAISQLLYDFLWKLEVFFKHGLKATVVLLPLGESRNTS